MNNLALKYFIGVCIFLSHTAWAAIGQGNDLQSIERVEIPVQNTMEDFNIATVEEPMNSNASAAWKKLANGPIVNNSIPLIDALHDLAIHWEGSDVSYLGYLLLTEKRDTKEKPKFDPVGAIEFLEASLRHPQIYFSNNHEASSQVIIADTIKQLMKSDQNIRAWQNCLKLRWLSPHIDVISSICRSAGNRANDRNASSYQTLRQSIHNSGVRLVEVIIDSHHRAVLSSYLSNPYNPDMLRQLIIYFGNTNQIVIGKQLLQEYCELDYECVWSAEKRWMDPTFVKLSKSRENESPPEK